jgi:hypothetical protein
MVPDIRTAMQMKRWWYMRMKSEGIHPSIEDEMDVTSRKMVSERLAMLINN